MRTPPVLVLIDIRDNQHLGGSIKVEGRGGYGAFIVNSKVTVDGKPVVRDGNPILAGSEPPLVDTSDLREADPSQAKLCAAKPESREALIGEDGCQGVKMKR